MYFKNCKKLYNMRYLLGVVCISLFLHITTIIIKGFLTCLHTSHCSTLSPKSHFSWLLCFLLNLQPRSIMHIFSVAWESSGASHLWQAMDSKFCAKWLKNINKKLSKESSKQNFDGLFQQVCQGLPGVSSCRHCFQDQWCWTRSPAQNFDHTMSTHLSIYIYSFYLAFLYMILLSKKISVTI